MTNLNNPTLVINKNWQAINVVAAAQALVMLWKGTAVVIDPEDYQQYDWSDWTLLNPEGDEQFIQTVTMRLRVPDVVRLSEFGDLPRNKVAFSRRNIHKRDRWTCQYCGIQPGSKNLTLDHVVARVRGGETTWDNCVSACLSCNHRKADKALKAVGMKLRKKPRQPIWSPLYAFKDTRIDTWSKFVSEAYWNVPLSP